MYDFGERVSPQTQRWFQRATVKIVYIICRVELWWHECLWRRNHGRSSDLRLSPRAAHTFPLMTVKLTHANMFPIYLMRFPHLLTWSNILELRPRVFGTLVAIACFALLSPPFLLFPLRRPTQDECMCMCMLFMMLLNSCTWTYVVSGATCVGVKERWEDSDGFCSCMCIICIC